MKFVTIGLHPKTKHLLDILKKEEKVKSYDELVLKLLKKRRL